jgi:hypothetical protein
VPAIARRPLVWPTGAVPFPQLADRRPKQLGRRLAVARRWLEANGLIEPAVECVLVPHSTEWFAALQSRDPLKPRKHARDSWPSPQTSTMAHAISAMAN